MQGIVMAGGTGSRLRPLTCDLPKPLVPLVNKPVMSYALELLGDLGIRQVGVTLQYLPEKIQTFYGSGGQMGLDISYYVEDRPLGTAGSIKNTGDLLHDTFVVISGDALTDFDLKPAIKFHQEKKALATLVLTKVNVPLEYGVVITNKDGRVTKFYEKPAWSDVFSDKVNTGIYILEPDVLDYIPLGEFFDFSKDLFPLLLQKGLGVYGISLNGYWCDIGDLNQYRQAQYKLLAGETKWRHRQGREMQPGVWIGHNTVVQAGARLIAPVVIGNDVFVSGDAEIGPLTVVGHRVNVSGNSSIKQSVIWPEASIRHADIRGAVVGRGVTVHAGARIYEGAAIGNDTRIGAKGTVKPRVLIWPEKAVLQEQTVKRNIVWGNAANDTDLDSPEKALALGRALANLWRDKDSALLVSFGSPQEEFKSIAVAVAMGAQASGMAVTRLLADVPTPVARHQVIKTALVGCHLALNDEGEIVPIFFDNKGAFLDNNLLRKLSHMLQRQDFDCLPSASWPPITEVNADIQGYLQQIEILCDAGRGKKIALSGLTLDFWLDQLKRLGHQVVFSNHISGVEEALRQGQADFGAHIDVNGDGLSLFSEGGTRLNTPQQDLLLSRLLFYHNNGGTVVLPSSSADAADQIAPADGRVIRTKANPINFWQQLVQEDIVGEQLWLKQYRVWDDAYSQLTLLADYLTKETVSLAGAVAQLPLKPRYQQTVSCPWENRGEVFRRLLEIYPEHKVDTTDGVRINHPQGWVMAIPHASRAEYTILGEGNSMEAAESLTGELEENIKKILES